VSQALIDALEEVFPDKSPDPGTPEYKIREQIGATMVVRFLREQRRKQQEDDTLGADLDVYSRST
jgi:hypothetical protein